MSHDFFNIYYYVDLHCVKHKKLFINQIYAPLFIKKLRLFSAFISGHHLAELVVVLTCHLSARDTHKAQHDS